MGKCHSEDAKCLKDLKKKKWGNILQNQWEYMAIYEIKHRLTSPQELKENFCLNNCFVIRSLIVAQLKKGRKDPQKRSVPQDFI